MIFKEKQKNKGITLIALVITIIVLLILAGVTIATLLGDNGVLTKATEAKNEQADATVEEAVKLAWNEYQMMLNEPTGERNESETKIASTSQVKIQGQEKNYSATPTMTFWQFLEEEKHYINEQGVIDVETLIGETLSRGNGTDGTTDVYKIEKIEDGSYVLVYYGEKSEDKTELATFTPGDSEVLEETDESYFDITDDGTISLKDHNDYYEGKEWTIETLVIPSKVDGKKVTAIDEDFMFSSNSNFEKLKTVIIPEGVSIIGRRAFCLCNELETIKIPNSVTKIGDRAFSGCDNLKNINIPNQLTTLEECTFQGASIEEITIPSSVTNIEDEVFRDCQNLNNIIILNNVVNMGYGVFRGWTPSQTINVEFENNQIPNTWDLDWQGDDCEAQVVYGYKSNE